MNHANNSVRVLLRSFILLHLTIAFQSAYAQNQNASAGIPNYTLNFLIQPWTSQCKNLGESRVSDCNVPQAIEGLEPETLTIEIKAVQRAGDASMAQKMWTAGPFKAEFKVYSVFPQENTSLPPYLQLRIELISPVRAICIQSVRWQEPFKAPPMICVGFLDAVIDQTPSQFGLTLTN